MIIDYGERIKERIENAYLPLTRLNLTMIFSIIHFPSALQFLYAYLSFYLVSLQSWREGNYRIMCSALWRGRLRLRDGLYLEQDRVSREWGPQSTEPRHTLRAGLVISSRLILFLTSQVLTWLDFLLSKVRKSSGTSVWFPILVLTWFLMTSLSLPSAYVNIWGVRINNSNLNNSKSTAYICKVFFSFQGVLL